MRLLAAALFFAFVTGPAASAQQAQGNAQGQDANPPAQAAASTAVPPPADEVSFIDKAKDWAQQHQIVERLNGDVDGWYPRLGGMTRGGGFAVGPGYRFHAGNVLVDVSAGISTKTYTAADVRVRWLQALDERLEFWTNYRYEDFPQEDYFGRGLTSIDTNRTSYDFDSINFSALGLFKPLPWLRLGTELGYMSPDIGEGTDANFLSIEQIFSDADAPGLLEQPDYLHTTFFADVDYRDERGRPRRGGFYHVALGFWNDRTLQQYDFQRFDANLSQWVPVDADKKHVVLGRIGLSYVNHETGSRVPFYYQPTLGGSQQLRGFREFRFRDRNSMVMSAEYRWEASWMLDAAVFVDAGKVAATRSDLNLRDLATSYGVGLRVHSNSAFVARLDLAFSREGFIPLLRFEHVF
jgi:outer membrane protein assembly factor BamA